MVEMYRVGLPVVGPTAVPYDILTIWPEASCVKRRSSGFVNEVAIFESDCRLDVTTVRRFYDNLRGKCSVFNEDVDWLATLNKMIISSPN